MAHVWLGGVQGFARVADVLRGVEDAEGETSEEIAGTQETSNGAESESRAVPQEVRNVLQLGNVVLSVSAVVHEQREDVVVFATRVSLVELREVVEDHAPRLDLALRVLDVGQRLPVAIVVGQVGKVLATGAVNGIRESRVIGI